MKLHFFYFLAIFAVIQCIGANPEELFNAMKSDLATLHAKEAKINRYLEQKIWFGSYLKIRNKLNPIIEKLLALNKSATKFLSKQKNKPNFPTEILSSFDEATKHATDILAKVFNDEDIQRIKSMTDEHFYGYYPHDAIRLMFVVEPLFRLYEIKKILTALEEIEGELNGLISKFDNINAAQMKERKTELVNAANSIKSLFTKLDENTEPLKESYNIIREKMRFSKKLITPISDNAEYIKLGSYEHFINVLPGILETPNGFNAETIRKFKNIWDKTGAYEGKIYDTVKNIQDYIDNGEAGIFDFKPFLKELRIHAESIHNDLTAPAESWYKKLLAKLQLFRKPVSNALIQSTIDRQGTLFRKLYDDEQVKIDESLKKIRTFVDQLIQSATEAVRLYNAIVGNNDARDQLNSGFGNYNFGRDELMKVREFVHEKHDIFDFQESQHMYD